MSFGTSLMQIRNERGISRKELAEQLDIPYTTLRNYETDQREPGHKLLIKMASILSVSVDELIGHRVHNKKIAPSYSDEALKLAGDYDGLDSHGQKIVRMVADEETERMKAEAAKKFRTAQKRADMEAAEDTAPVVVLRQPYAQVAAAEGSGAFPLDDGYDETAVYLNEYTQKADVILKVVGRSMQPDIMDGDRILVRIQPSVNIGEIGVFVLDGEGYLKQSGKDKLVSLNPDIDDVMIGNQQKVECYGKFISVLKPEWIVE